MECGNCESNNLDTWNDRGDNGYICKDCGRVIENGVLIEEGKTKN